MPAFVVLIALLFVAAAGSIIAGVFLLAGLAWALIAGGAFMLAAAWLLRGAMRQIDG